MSPTRTATIGAVLVAMGSVSMALYTPAMPALVKFFATDPATIKLTLTAYFFGFAFAQLISGPMSDALGRRPTALGFFVFYMLGSLICVVAPSVTWLLVGRILQGIGAAAGVALSRAIVRDQFTGQASAKIMNTIGLMLALGPALSPTIGGVMLLAFGWHSIFVLMLIYGIGLILLVIFGLPETLAERDPAHLRPLRILRNYLTLLSDRRFLAPSLIVGLTLGGLYTLAGILPFVLVDKVGLTEIEFGLGMLMQSASFLTGAGLTGQILKHREARTMVPVGLGFVLLGAIAMAIVLRLVEPTFLTVMIPVGIWAFGIAFLLPSTTTDALAHFPTMAGAASAMMGFLQIGGGFAGTAIASLFNDPLEALATIMPIMGFGALAIYLTIGGSGRSRRPVTVATAAE
ncbi:multidrug effflux MFS transporter [Rhodoligotrophos appendicifer]|uniref:multidrug effflux MFS transporter n=1 Tax=Rhodoligotrophos appendicifer TaxID=987056 RepID=UPI001186F96C